MAMRTPRKLSLVLSGIALSVLAIGLASGCGGYGEKDATDRCTIEQTNHDACFSADTFDACVSCFEECGDACAVAESCPVQYVCPQ